MMGQAKTHWSNLTRQVVAAAAVVDSKLTEFSIPDWPLYWGFGCVIDAFTIGSVTVKLRFAWATAQLGAIALSPQGLDFRLLNAVNQTDYKSVAFGVAAAAPNVAGSAPAVLPPRVGVFITTDGVNGFTGTFRVIGAGLWIP